MIQSKIKEELESVDAKIRNNSTELLLHLTGLPKLLQEGIDVLQDRNEKEVYFIGAIGVISGILPSVYGIYDGKKVYPNLFCYIVARYGAGKGSLTYCRYLALEIHKMKKALLADLINEYESQKKAFQDGILKEKPSKPSQKLVFIPANNSKTGMLDLLQNNEGKGIIFETEGDTMADNIKQDYGNYSNVFRMAFHHESISYNRRTDKEYSDIENPTLSVVLSSTFDQLKKLIPNIENGLFSRFLFYQFDASDEFKNVFAKEKSLYPECFRGLSIKFKNVYDRLMDVDEIEFSLTEEQQALFMKFFSEMKKKTAIATSKDLDGTVHRLGLICFRLCMIFTTLRIFEDEDREAIPKSIICSDNDFEKVIKIVEILKFNAFSIYRSLPKPSQKHEGNNTDELQIYECIKSIESVNNSEGEKLSLSAISKRLRTEYGFTVDRNKVDRIKKKYNKK